MINVNKNSLSFIKENLRINLSNYLDRFYLPNLLKIQLDSFSNFYKFDNSGIEYVLHSIFPICSYNGNVVLKYISYELEDANFSYLNSIKRNITYSCSLKIKVCLINNRIKKKKYLIQDIYLFDFPLMTNMGSFVINGTERVVVPQLYKSIGIVFEKLKNINKTISYVAKIIPKIGVWLDIELDSENMLIIKIDKKKKIKPSIFFKSFGININLVLNTIFRNKLLNIDDIKYKEYVLDIFSKNFNDKNHKLSIDFIDKNKSRRFIKKVFFDRVKYNLSYFGRFKINKRIGLNSRLKILSRIDIILIISKLIDVKNGLDYLDDIDSLNNKKIRRVGDIIQNLFRLGFVKIRQGIKEKLTYYKSDKLIPEDIVNTKSISLLFRKFFCTSQLSQFMDQNNPLSEITHKRKVTALGFGGLTKERVNFEIRDVNITHYGRLCPIETPEGPNIGLINSLSLYSKIGRNNLLETPYLKIVNGFFSKNLRYFSSFDEYDYVICQNNLKHLPVINKLLNNYISCRYKNKFITTTKKKIHYMDISSKQIISIASSLIPFLEHNDANRALMGSNMQRQSLPILDPEFPLVGTGMEKYIAKNSKNVIYSNVNGFVIKVNSSNIMINTNKLEEVSYNNNNIFLNYNLLKYNCVNLNDNLGFKIKSYFLNKFIRTNYNTCINQKPFVNIDDYVIKNEIIVDGMSTNYGELSLGRNILVGFLSWYGYNFEDSIVISENLIKSNKFISIHIEKFLCYVKDLKLGNEEVTIDIPNIDKKFLLKLDNYGVIKIGSMVFSGDILVGKISRKSESKISPEEKLLRVIFGKKVYNIKNISLLVPQNTEGVIIDVNIFIRDKLYKDARVIIEENKIYNNDNVNFNCEFIEQKNKIICNAKKYFYNFKYRGYIVTKNFIYNLCNDLFDSLKISNIFLYKKMFFFKGKLFLLKLGIGRRLFNKKKNINLIGDLSPGILKIIKVFLAKKRQLQPGDKMSGRHGNKGIVSSIISISDMPYLNNGISLEMILNPLGVPSRMNVGQVLEIHLGCILNEVSRIIKFNINKYNIKQVKNVLHYLYNLKKKNINFNNFNNK